MVRRINGWTENGDEYGIVGGESYVKEDGCYFVILARTNRVLEDYKVPSKDLTVEELKRRLEGPFEDDKGLFGREFLKKFGKKSPFDRRLPPK